MSYVTCTTAQINSLDGMQIMEINHYHKSVCHDEDFYDVTVHVLSNGPVDYGRNEVAYWEVRPTA